MFDDIKLDFNFLKNLFFLNHFEGLNCQPGIFSIIIFSRFLLFVNLFPICSLYVPCMFPVCSLYVPFMFPVCSLYVLCKFPACSPYVPCMLPVCSLYVPCMFALFSLYNILPVCSLYGLCMLPVCSLYVPCTVAVLRYLIFYGFCIPRVAENRSFFSFC